MVLVGAEVLEHPTGARTHLRCFRPANGEDRLGQIGPGVWPPPAVLHDDVMGRRSCRGALVLVALVQQARSTSR